MSQLPICMPPALYRGWDVQFSRIARYAGPRLMAVLTALARQCLERGNSVRIEHRLQDDLVCSRMRVLGENGQTAVTLSFVLHDGWLLSRQPGALLDVELRQGDTGRTVVLELRRASKRFSVDPAEVYFNAGDAVSVNCLQGPLLACL